MHSCQLGQVAGLLGGRRPKGSMQALPDLMRFSGSMVTEIGLVNENCTIMSKMNIAHQSIGILSASRCFASNMPITALDMPCAGICSAKLGQRETPLMYVA